MPQILVETLFWAEQAAAALPGASAATPASSSDAHAPLGGRDDAPLPLHLALALRALSPPWLAGRSRPACATRLLGDGAKDVIAFAQELAPRSAQSEAPLAQDHASAGGFGWTRPLVVLQLGEVGGVAVGNELETQKMQNGFICVALKMKQHVYMAQFRQCLNLS